MPQMFPLLWAALSLSCIIALIMISSFIYQNFAPHPEKAKSLASAPHTTWKW